MTDSAQDNPFGSDMYAVPMGISYDINPPPKMTEAEEAADHLRVEREYLASEAAEAAAGSRGADPSAADAETPETATALASPELAELAHNPLAGQLLTTGESSPAIEQHYVAQQQESGQDAKPAPAVPTSLEKAIGSIRLDGERQENFVMLGDPRIQDHFYNNLRALGKVNGRGELLCSLKEAEKHYIAAAKELGEDIRVVHAMELSYKREGDGVLGSIKSGIQNALGREHHMVVMVAGDQGIVDAKMKELGGLVQQMVEAKMLPEGNEDSRSKVEFRDVTDPGSLVIPQGGLNLQGTGKLADLVNLTADVVNAHTRAEAEKRAEREALRNKASDEKTQEAKEKASGGAEGGASNSPAQPVNAFALEQADKLAAAMASPEALKTLGNDSKKQDGTKGSLEGVVLARGINKITAEEFASLPAERRHEMLVQMAALVVKAESQELVSKVRAEVTAPAFREKLRDLVAAEPNQARLGQSGYVDAGTPMFVRDLAARGMLQPDQIERLAAMQGFESARVAQFDHQVEVIAQAGPQAFTEGQAQGVLDRLNTIRVWAVRDVAPAGAAATEMLARLDGILKEVESGRFGPEMAGRVPELRKTLDNLVDANQQAYADDKFKGGEHVYAQDVASAQRQVAEWHSERAPAEPVKPEVPQETVKPEGVGKEGIASVGSSPKGVEPSSATAEASVVAPPQAAPARAQDDRAARDTDMAVARLAKTFDNIQVMLLEKDSNAWRTNNVETLARAVTRLDPAEVAKRSASERAVIVAQAKWVEAQAASGRLPGFVSGEGKVLAEQMKARVAELAPLAKRPPDKRVRYKLENADRMVAALRSREQGLAQDTTPARQQEAPSPAAVARDLTHAVHHQPVISDASAKYLLKAVEKSGLSLETMKDLDPETKARAAVALNFLAREAKAGTIGDLSPAVQRYADNAEAKANQLFDAYAKDPQVSIPLTKASFELADRTGALDIPANDARRGAPEKTAHQATEKAAGLESAPSTPAPSAGRERGER